MDRLESEGYRLAIREVIEIIHSAPLPRLNDEGTEYVARDPLAEEVHAHALRRLRIARSGGSDD